MGKAAKYRGRENVRYRVNCEATPSHILSRIVNDVDLWLFPAVLLIAWFYYPYCLKGPSLCIWKALTHQECLGCGLTRGFCFLVHGEFQRALSFNRLSPVAFLVMGVNFVAATRSWFGARGMNDYRERCLRL